MYICSKYSHSVTQHSRQCNQDTGLSKKKNSSVRNNIKPYIQSKATDSLLFKTGPLLCHSLWEGEMTKKDNLIFPNVMKTAGRVGRIASFLPKDNLKVMFYSLINSSIITVAQCGAMPLSDMNSLQIALNKAARMI